MAVGCERIRELASGFVLGALEPAEMAAVREHLARCTEPHPELRELGGVVAYLADVVDPVEPPERLRAAIFAAAEADLRARKRSDRAAERLVAALGGTPPAGDARRASRPEPDRGSNENIPTLEPTLAGPARGLPQALRPVNGEGPVTASPARETGEAAEGSRPDERTAAALAPPIAIAARRSSRTRRIVGWASGIAAALLILGLGMRVVAVQDEATKAKAAADRAKTAAEAVIEPQSHSVLLRPIDVSSKASGAAILRSTGHLLVYVYELTPTKGSEVYVVWLRADAGSPVAAASFAIDDMGNNLVDIASVPSASSLEISVTREANADAKAPSGPPVVTGTLIR